MAKLTVDKENQLKEMYHKVEEDFKKFPFIRTTEDFFIWREAVKQANGNNGELRNEEIENMIRGNRSLELLYNWTKFYRMVDRAKASVYVTKVEYGLDDSDSYRIKAAGMLHRHLTAENKANSEQLFGIFQIPELNLGVRHPLQRTINTPYEFEKAIVKEDESEPWPAILFVTLLNAYGITSEDLLTVGRDAERLSNEYVREIKNNYSIASGAKVYKK